MAWMKQSKLRRSLIRQRDISDCGPACLASVCAYYGLYAAVSQIRQIAFTNQNGTSIIGLVEAAINLNFNAKGIRAKYESLNLTSLPAIIHVKNGDSGHYMVLMKLTSWGVTVMDPAEGRLKNISEKEFRKIWTGIMVLMTPGDKFQRNKKVSDFSKFTELVTPYKNSLIMIVVCAAIVSLLGLSMSLYIKKIVDEILVNKKIALLDTISVIVIMLLLIQFFVSVVRNRLVFKTGKAINSELIKSYYTHLLKLPQPFLDSMRVGEMLSRINDAVKITAFVHDLAVNVVVNILIVVFSFSMMFYYNWRIASVIILVMPIYGLLYYISSRVNGFWQRRIAVSGAEFDTFLVESIAAATTIRNLSAERYFCKKAATKLDALLNNLYNSSTKQTYIHGIAELTSKTFIVLLLWIGCYNVIGNRLTAGELILFYTLLAWVTMPVLYLLDAIKNSSEALIAAERLFEILEIQPDRDGWKKLYGIQRVEINFKAVHFAYGNKEPLLRGIDLQIPSARIIGIRGRSGSGKSTLASLLLRMYRPTNGSICINNIDINEFDRENLCGLISIVSQKTDLFSASIIDNIVLGQKYDEDRLADICERLGIMKCVELLPDGLNTMVSEQGSNFSGGQKQHIAIARALYRNTPVLILDEATVSIDPGSEEKIMQTIEWYKNQGNTVIIIAHSESSLKICDNIAVLEDGVIK